MHLLAARPGVIDDGEEAVDLGQDPGDLVLLSAADSDLACLAAAFARLSSPPFSLRLANLLRLSHPMSVDLYVERVVEQARMVVVRLLGGRAYWPYGLEQIAESCRTRGVPLAVLPGDGAHDPDLAAFSTVSPAVLDRLSAYLDGGGIDNAVNFLRFAGSVLDGPSDWLEPKPLPPAGWYPEPPPSPPRILLTFYRAAMLAGDTAPVDALLAALKARGLEAAALFVRSLKDPLAAAMLEAAVAAAPPDLVINATGFAVSTPGRPDDGPFAAADCPVIQVIFASGSRAAWFDGTRGLAPRDLAMSVALPEVDGRLIGRAIAFKQGERDQATQCDLARHQPLPDRVAFIADLAEKWLRLRQMPPARRRIALVLANYPNRDGRVGNGVGLDTPASTVAILVAMAAAGYDVNDVPADGDALMRRILAGPTNDWAALKPRADGVVLALTDYHAFFDRLPKAVRTAIDSRWGAPENDPFVQDGAFQLPVTRFGRAAVVIQPARGYNIDPVASAHDPDLVPPHNYLAVYAWLRHSNDAVVHVGKHGNLEWLPGKAVALSENCFPDAVLGPMPHLYPFIVNDPGEGTQAKRRAAAVIVDHLTPPLTRAGGYGAVRDLERLVDEYYQAAGLDPRRLPVLEREILSLAAASGIDREVGIDHGDDPVQALAKLDRHLCDIKEMQIRDGLHIFGRSPEGEQRTRLLAALVRGTLVPALARDLGLDLDPFDADPAQTWNGPRPLVLTGEGDWRSTGDTIERLEDLAERLAADPTQADPAWTGAAGILTNLRGHLAPAVESCGQAEIAGLLRGLDGRFVPPGPSGAPTRGRPDVLPTGRNFYSVDTRMVPTPAAWSLGWASAQKLLERHFQDFGDWPRTVALTAWGTSAMRTGGDDIAQALALMGVRPAWDPGSGRVSGFEILPASLLDRPRVDVTLRVSGFFRDAFPALIDLFDSAVRAVAALDEPEAVNPLAAKVAAETPALGARAGARVFGSKPGAYGAGLQTMIDERLWTTQSDLAEAYIAWGGWVYGHGAEGDAAHDVLRTRLAQTEAVIQNQDNREHDLLDSDDYYQFEGGLTAAVRAASGKDPAVWHADHSRPHAPRIRSLDEEVARVVRARVVNPKWIAGVMRHGYKGAFEMAATVDYLFAFAATTRAVKDHQFDLVAEAYLADEAVVAFLERVNPAALAEIRARLREAIDRGLWRTRRNDVERLLSTPGS